MKTFFLFSFLLITIVASAIEKKPSTASTKSVGQLYIECSNHGNSIHSSDSVLVIFDKYDRTGAGVIYKMMHTDESGNFLIDDIPPGKYYVTLIYQGIHKEKKEKILTIKKNKLLYTKVSLEQNEEYVAGSGTIPATKFNMNKLSILKMK
jgi:adenine specific DNA methylase Mod